MIHAIPVYTTTLCIDSSRTTFPAVIVVFEDGVAAEVGQEKIPMPHVIMLI